MKILIVSGAFYPTNSPRSFRTTELTKQFIKLGHEVTIYIPKVRFDYSSFLKEYPVDIKTYKDVKERRHFLGIAFLDRVIFRVFNQFFEYPNILFKQRIYEAVKNERGYDLLVTIAVPHQIHWALGRIYKKGNIVAKTWIADCGDPFMLNCSGSYKPMFYFKKYEKCWCNCCDYISVPTEASKDGYYPEFRKKICTIPQGFNFEEIETLTYKKNPVPTFAYSGSFIPGLRDPRPILKYLFNSRKKFKIIFYTNGKNLLQEYKSQEGMEIIVKEYIPRIDLIRELSQMDFLLNIANGNVTSQTPSKLIDYALTGRPILSLSSLNIDTKLIDAFLNGDYSKQLRVPNIEQYNIKTVAQQFLDLCK